MISTTRRSLHGFGLLLFAAVLLAAIPATAGSIDPSAFDNVLWQGFDGNGNMWMMNPNFQTTPNLDPNTGDFSFAPPTQTPQNGDAGAFSVTDIQIYGNVDPVINTNFSVHNNTGVTQDYTFIFAIPVVPQGPSTLSGGSFGVTITEGNGNTATLGTHTNGRPNYYSQIDGADWVALDVSPLTEPNAFQTETDSAVFGAPIPSLPGPAATSTIGIRYDFSLTAGDSAAITGVFVVEAVPEPATATLLIAGLLLGVACRKRS